MKKILSNVLLFSSNFFNYVLKDWQRTVLMNKTLRSLMSN